MNERDKNNVWLCTSKNIDLFLHAKSSDHLKYQIGIKTIHQIGKLVFYISILTKIGLIFIYFYFGSD